MPDVTATRLAPVAPKTWLSPDATFDALQFDGSRASALALSRAYKNRVALSVEHDAVLLVWALNGYDREGLHEMSPGSWLVRDRLFYGAPRMLTDQHFRAVFTPSFEKA